ncbi:hypothetical protein TNIN_182561 [Trichonephila inaurata madagascariensis]|uniref:Uncharacterized protein n=1 Tax=Trichonephila inaurata madagascariensis TaxID=2747483 RepID=A0A8X6Y399_9ARAC|nr:hypothetical protein TNIN_182561 [Trichonephila inaurata madagascariensis]
MIRTVENERDCDIRPERVNPASKNGFLKRAVAHVVRNFIWNMNILAAFVFSSFIGDHEELYLYCILFQILQFSTPIVNFFHVSLGLEKFVLHCPD